MKKTIIILFPLLTLVGCVPVSFVSGYSYGSDHADRLQEPDRSALKKEIVQEIKAELYTEIKDILISPSVQEKLISEAKN